MTPWHQGREAYRQGKGLKDNPFAESNDHHEAWVRGWTEMKEAFGSCRSSTFPAPPVEGKVVMTKPGFVVYEKCPMCGAEPTFEPHKYNFLMCSCGWTHPQLEASERPADELPERDYYEGESRD